MKQHYLYLYAAYDKTYEFMRLHAPHIQQKKIDQKTDVDANVLYALVFAWVKLLDPLDTAAYAQQPLGVATTALKNAVVEYYATLVSVLHMARNPSEREARLIKDDQVRVKEDLDLCLQAFLDRVITADTLTPLMTQNISPSFAKQYLPAWHRSKASELENIDPLKPSHTVVEKLAFIHPQKLLPARVQALKVANTSGTNVQQPLLGSSALQTISFRH